MGDGHFPQVRQNRGHPAQRVVGHVQAEHFTFEIQLGFLIPLLDVRHHDQSVAHRVGAPIVIIGKQIKLAFRLLAFEPDYRFDRRLMNLVKRPTVRVD